MTLAIMQPYIFPYIGYFQLMNAADEFVLYDNIEFTKKGWINRNRILVNGKDEYISFPLKKDSDYLDIVQRELADTWPEERKKMLNRITESYRKAPHFTTGFAVAEKAIMSDERNLFRFALNTIQVIKEYLGITTPIVVSSDIAADHTLKSADRVISICKARNADTYLNPIGGVGLYAPDHFLAAGLQLRFIKTNAFTYKQFANDFIPFLSILDVMMFNSREEIKEMLTYYTIQE